MTTTIPASSDILEGYCGPIEWAMLDAPGKPVWRRAVWGPIGPSSEPERMGIVNAGDMRGDIAMRLPLAHPLAVCHAARWLATRLGWRLNVLSAVQWVSESKAFSRNVRRTFVLSYSFHRHWFHDDPLLLRAIERGAINKFGLEALTHVPGIAPKDASDMSEAERVAALAAACVAVGAKNG